LASCITFDEFIKKYDKHYTDLEYNNKKQVFLENTKLIEEHNRKESSYKLGMNKFGDMTFTEFKNTYLLKPIKNEHYGKNLNTTQTKYDIPDNFDWRSEGVISNVKDQKDCGSCWAFSAVLTMEAQHAIKTKNLVELSEQNLVDCIPESYDCSGCGGGWPFKAIQYISDTKGVDTELSYPYTALDGKCSFNKSTVGALFNGYTNVSKGDDSLLGKTVYEVGPLSIAILATNNFMFYSSGVFTLDPSACTNYVDHAVGLIGYGVTKNGTRYYIVRNSWGTSWGMDGYVYWNRDPQCLCGICDFAVSANA